MSTRAKQSATPPLQAVYEELYAEWGAQYWWPGRTRFEVIVGAILTQNTAWTNVEKAIKRLRGGRLLTPAALHAADLEEVSEWIRPAGYFRVKARRLRAFTTMLFEQFDGRLSRFFALETMALREVLLAVNGIGPETADSILLYAAGRRQFVVDAYTRRLLSRHGWLDTAADYDEAAQLFVDAVVPDIALYNEYHALIVRLGKTFCRPVPRCATCPLRHRLPSSGPLPAHLPRSRR